MRLSVVIPTLDEEPALREMLPRVLAYADEVCVSDGGSRDRTVETAREFGVRVVEGPPGRGGQLRRGAETCRGDALLFLHADTRLPEGGKDLILRELAAGAVGGGFCVRYDDERSVMRIADRLINLRTRLTGCPLGDQAQFVVRETYEALGGFRDWPILEDLDFARRLKRQGKTALVSEPIVTSARRFQRQGMIRTVATNWLIWQLYFFGVSPRKLARLYRNLR